MQLLAADNGNLLHWKVTQSTTSVWEAQRKPFVGLNRIEASKLYRLEIRPEKCNGRGFCSCLKRDIVCLNTAAATRRMGLVTPGNFGFEWSCHTDTPSWNVIVPCVPTRKPREKNLLGNSERTSCYQITKCQKKFVVWCEVVPMSIDTSQRQVVITHSHVVRQAGVCRSAEMT